ncbi:MAG TPA: hypothetical protein PLV68_11210 [Ilumatobacteraceae bacterium]|nr:hypothetical protein [Ilumatobacteraceae bacterium]
MSDTNQIGKRYQCATCGLTVIVAKKGAGRVSCHGTAMEMLTNKPLPSSD